MSVTKRATTIAAGIHKTTVIWALAAPVLRVAGFLFVTTLALRTLSAEEIGLWYVLINLGSLAGNIEMGMSPTVGRSTTYLMAGRQDLTAMGIALPASAEAKPEFGRLAGLLVSVRRLYRWLGVASAAIVIGGGGRWLGTHSAGGSETGFGAAPLLIMALGCWFSMAGLYWSAILHGMNRVRMYYVLTVAGMLSYYAVASVGLCAGAGLTAMVAGFVLMAAVPRVVARRVVLASIPAACFDSPSPVKLSVLWPMSWRTGAASLFSNLTIPVTTLFCASFSSLETAASYGLCMQAAFALHALGQGWLSVRYPALARLRTENRLAEVRSICAGRITAAAVTYAAGAVACTLLLPHLLRWIGSNTAPLPTGQLALMFVVVGLDLVVGLHASAIQTGNRLPYLPAYAVAAALACLLGPILGARFGVWGFLAAPLIGQTVWSHWWTPILLWKPLLGAPAQDDAAKEHRC